MPLMGFAWYTSFLTLSSSSNFYPPSPRILVTCHGVLYKQLSAWMLHGLLLDEEGEFFIEAIKQPNRADTEVYPSVWSCECHVTDHTLKTIHIG